MGGRIPRACADEMGKIHRAQYQQRTARSSGCGLPGFSVLFHGSTMNALAGCSSRLGASVLSATPAAAATAYDPGYAERIGWEITPAGEAAVRDVQHDVVSGPRQRQRAAGRGLG